MDGQLVGQDVTAARGLDGIHVSDDVCDSHVGRGELLHETVVTGDPRHGSAVPLGLEQDARVFGDGPERIVVDLAALQDRHLGIQGGQRVA